jgi:hypothetical protein
MRIVSGVAIVALAFGVACANKSPTTSTPQSGGATTSGGASAGGAPGGATAGRGAGAQAAARLTPDDLDARMKIIGPASGTLRMKLMTNQLADAAKDAQTLAQAFGDVERFWAQNNKADAVMWAQTARMGAQDAAAAATAGDAAKATAAAGNMQAQCKQCHAVYREGDAQSGFHIKAGAL